MSQRPIPEFVEQFVLAHFHSVEQLEALLFLKMHPEQSWSAASVSAALRTNPASTAQKMGDLHAQGLVSRSTEPGGASLYRYAPLPGDAEAIDALARYFASHRVRVIELIYSRPPTSIRKFAEAFHFRKDDDE
jgi:hypothetical protein